jgi:hypothetical protein
MRKRIVIFSHLVNDVYYLPKNICVENGRKKITIVFFSQMINKHQRGYGWVRMLV